MRSEQSRKHTEISQFRMEEGLLKRLYRRYVGGEPREGCSLIDELIACFGHPERFSEIHDSMTAKEKRFLACLFELGGTVPESVLFDELVTSFGEPEEAWGATLVSLSSTRLLVFRINVPGSPEPLICFPSFLQPAFESMLKDSARLFRVQRESPAMPGAGGLDPVLLRSVAVFVCQQGIRLTRDGQIFKRHKDRLEDFFVPALDQRDGAGLLGLHLWFLQWLGCAVETKAGGLKIQLRFLRRLLEAPSATLLALWKKYVAGLGSHEKVIDAAISDLPEGTCVSDADLDRHTRRALLREHVRSWSLLSDEERNAISDRGAFRAAVSRMAAAGIVKVLLADGQARMQFAAGSVVQRLRNAGTGSALGTHDVATFVVLPTCEIIAERDLSHDIFLDLARVAFLESYDAACVFRICKESIASAAKQGLSGEQIRSLLEGKARHGLSSNIRTEINHWIERVDGRHCAPSPEPTEKETLAFNELLAGNPTDLHLRAKSLGERLSPEPQQIEALFRNSWNVEIAHTEVNTLVKDCPILYPWQVRDLFQEAIRTRRRVAVEYVDKPGSRPLTKVISPRLLARRPGGLVIQCAPRAHGAPEELFLDRISRACILA